LAKEADGVFKWLRQSIIGKISKIESLFFKKGSPSCYGTLQSKSI
jgi:hypothetical protein